MTTSDLRVDELVKLADELRDVALRAVEHVGRLNDHSRDHEAKQWVRRASDKLTSAIRLAEAGMQEAVLCCDVRLPPVTTIRAGCKVSTLMAAINVRENWSDEERHFTAPPAPSVEVKVKALEWRPGDRCAVTSIGVYTITCWSKCNFTLMRLQHSEKKYDTLEAAKAAAQLDYEQRITSALIPAPQDDVREALEQALERMKMAIEWWNEGGHSLPQMSAAIEMAEAALRGKQSDGGVEAQWQKEEVSPGVFVPVDPEVIAQASATTLSSRPEVDHCPRCDCGHLFETCDAPNCDSAVKYHMEGRE